MPSGILDPRTGASVAVSGDHHYIHEGVSFAISGDTASISSSGSESIRFITPPATKCIVHLRPPRLSSVGNSASITITEGAVMSSGTAAVPRNRNRLKGDTSKVLAYTAATLTTAGTTIYKDSVATGGAVANGGGSSAGADDEIILKPDTTYSMTITNTGATTATVATYYVKWYEERS